MAAQRITFASGRLMLVRLISHLRKRLFSFVAHPKRSRDEGAEQ
jgi:hypothetical protein